jgi:hypothetical protein
MIGSSIANLAYTLTNTNSSTFLDGNSTNLYVHLNTLYGHRVLDILRVRVDRNATINEATTTLKSTVGLVEGDNGFNGEYAFPSDLLKPVRFEVSYDGINFKKARIYDNALNLGSEYNDTQLAGDFSEDAPCVDFTRNSFKIRPPKTTAGDITKGIYIEYEQRQTDFTSATTPTQIESNLQDILAYDLAELEFIMHPEAHTPTQMNLFKQKKKEVEDRFLEFYKSNLPKNKIIAFKYQDYQ